jgi:predicted transcriptional regulator
MLAFSRVSTVEVSSVKLPISFNMKAIAEFEKETGSQLFDLLNRLGKSAFDSSIIPLIWAALEEGHRIDNKEMDFTREDVEAMDLDILMLFIKALTESVERMNPSEKKQLAATGNKKKVSLAKV